MDEKERIAFEENLVKAFGSLDSTIYSRKRFIAYIKKFLESDGIGKEYQFKAGKDLEVDVKTISENVFQVTYSYNQGVGPSATVTQFVAEWGREFAIGELDIIAEVTRKDYPLEQVVWGSSEVTPAIAQNTSTLSSILRDQKYTAPVKNAKFIAGTDLTVASGGVYKDTKGKGGELKSSITRQTRHFYGKIQNPTDPIILSNLSSVLGSLPSNLTIDHGPTPHYFIIVTTADIEVFASGLRIGTSKLENVTLNPNVSFPSYTKDYKVYISTGNSTGTFTFQVK